MSDHSDGIDSFDPTLGSSLDYQTGLRDDISPTTSFMFASSSSDSRSPPISTSQAFLIADLENYWIKVREFRARLLEIEILQKKALFTRDEELGGLLMHKSLL